MAKLSYQLMPPEYEEHFRNNLSPNWRFELPRIMRTERLISRKKREALIQQTFLLDIATLWRAFSEAEKEDWDLAGAEKGLSGWHLFVHDQAIRIKKSLPGTAQPSLLHQGRVGHIKIEAPASEIEIVQPHPRFYWLSRIAPGRYPLTELQWTKEVFTLPLKISLNYRAELTSLSGNSFAFFVAWIWSVAEGKDFFTPLYVPLSLSKDWNSSESTMTEVPGVPVSYDLYFDLFDVRGDLFFDNLVAEHSGYNWVRDPHCKAIDEEFSRSFFQVLSNWIPINVPSGASYLSEYFDFEPPPTPEYPASYGLAEFGLSDYGFLD